MKRLTAISIIALFLLLNIRTSTYAFDWKSLNVELVNQTENDSQEIVLLRDKQDQTFKVIYQDEAMLKKISPKIMKYKNEFFTWQSIHIKDITFMVFANFLDVVIIPQEFMHNNQNLATAIPAGITMTYDPDMDVMRYDFRIMKEPQFVRITGYYSQESELTNKIGMAYDDPAGYLQSNNPVSPKQVNVEQMNEKMVQALIYLNNEDWNGRHIKISIETIQKVVDLKKAHPEVTTAGLWRMVKKEKIKISKRQFELILILYFNQFE
jgi:hypothetical protein